MGTGIEFTGEKEILLALELLEDPYRLTQEVADRLNAAYADGMKPKRNKIPDDTGDLKRSLTWKKDYRRPAEIGGSGDVVNIVSTLPQAKYQSDRIPAPETDVMSNIIANLPIETLVEIVGES